MQALYDNFGFIIGFLAMILILKSVTGEKAAVSVLSVVLLSMALLNHDKIRAKLGNMFNL